MPHKTLKKKIIKSIHGSAIETSVLIPEDFDLSDDFKDAFDLMEHTREHIFITGKAGTGKSTLLEYFKQNTKKEIVVLAPTGVAAIKVGGQTLHSFFNLPPVFIQKEHIKRSRNSAVMKRIDSVIIDEASMLRADLMDGIDYSLRINRNNFDEPFGGAQIIIFGDLFQLPPVVDKEMGKIMSMVYSSPYFFGANVINEVQLKYIELKKIYRQKEPYFIELLNKIRVKDIACLEMEDLNKRVEKDIRHDEGVITLTTTNYGADRINSHCLAQIGSEKINYFSEVKGKFDEKSYPAESCLSLKAGAQVMLIKNDKEKRWVNGTIGTIARLTGSVIEVNIGGHIYDVPKVIWEKNKYIYNKAEDKIEAEVIGSYEQYPIKLAWAITIHKSQGQTFENVIIDMGQGAFTHGQTYVALSRCRRLDGIALTQPIRFQDIIFDERIYEFVRKMEGRPTGMLAGFSGEITVESSGCGDYRENT